MNIAILSVATMILIINDVMMVLSKISEFYKPKI